MADDRIESNVKKIWDALDKHFALTLDELRTITKLDDRDLLQALDWMHDLYEVFLINMDGKLKFCLTENE